MTIAKDFAELLSTRLAAGEPDDRPIYYLWTYDPHADQIHLDHNEDKHPAHHITHDELAPHVKDAIDGFAYSIKGGWRITEFDTGGKEKPGDPYIIKRVLEAVSRKHPPKDLPFVTSAEGESAIPRIRYHGSP